MTITIKVRREVAELAEKMVKYGLARSRSHAINLMIERGIKEVMNEVSFWEELHEGAEMMEKEGLKIRHGGLSEILKQSREER